MSATDPATGLPFAPERLDAFLKSSIPGLAGEMRLERIAGGQSNPTYYVDFDNRRLVLRKRPPGTLLPSAHSVDREFRVIKALAATDVPVPRLVLFHGDDDIVGTPFYVMERIEGRVFRDCAMPGVATPDRRAMYFSLADAMSKLHAVDPVAVGLGDFGKPGDYFERQIGRWSGQWQESPSRADYPAIDELVGWLKAHKPADDGLVTIVHGDFRVGNMMFHPTEPRIVAILDWELSTLGHPLADLAYCCIAWNSWPDEYGGLLGTDGEALNIPTQRVFVDRYLKGSPKSGDLKPFHIVFVLFRLAMIFVGIADRAKRGTAAAANAAEIGRLAGRFAGRGLDVIAGRPPVRPA
jgi:aminoglycoside phosphotransferase (APT) family kinase protein